jgi:hypothetical protein
MKEVTVMATREEEYLRRMKALGYEPSLAGMDDDDIEWELSKMEEAERRRAAVPQQPTRTVYRPVDPGLKARILRQFGQPYDESAIDPRESFYLNGWDNGEDDAETWQGKAAPGVSAPYQGGRRKSDINDPDFDPWKNAWRLDWGPEGNSPAQLRTMEYRPGRDGNGGIMNYVSAADSTKPEAVSPQGGVPQDGQHPNPGEVKGSRTEKREAEKVKKLIRNFGSRRGSR